MFFPEGQLRVYLYGEPTDMRRSFNGLSAMVRQKLSADPLD
jgi:transposase